MKKIAILAVVLILLGVSAETASAKVRAGGGFRSSSSVKTSTTRTSTPKPVTTTPKPPPAPKPVNTTKVNSKTVTKTDTQAKKVDGKTYSKKGYVVDDNYKPRFAGGYSAPAGSIVYYQSSMWDWFPLYYIMTHGSHKEAVVEHSDGKTETVKEEGKDSMYYINWILTIILLGGLGIGLVYLVNKLTNK